MGCIKNKQIVTRCTSPITHTHTHASYIKTFPFYTTKLILVNELKNKNNTGQLTRYTTTTTTDSQNRTKTFFFSPLSILLLKSLKQEKAEKQKFIFRNQTSHFIHRIFLYLYIYILDYIFDNTAHPWFLFYFISYFIFHIFILLLNTWSLVVHSFHFFFSCWCCCSCQFIFIIPTQDHSSFV